MFQQVQQLHQRGENYTSGGAAVVYLLGLVLLTWTGRYLLPPETVRVVRQFLAILHKPIAS